MLQFSKKARKIGIKTNSIVTKFFSYKMNRFIECESLLESNLCYLLEFDSKVKEYTEQPFTIQLSSSKYTPDFYVIYTDGKEEIYEVKEFQKLYSMKAKLDEAKEYFTNRNIEFKILTEKDFNGQLGIKLTNLKFLYRYISPPKEMDLFRNKLIYIVTIAKKLSIQEILNQFPDNQKLNVLPTIWHLIATGKFHIDLLKPITNQSQVCYKTRSA